MFDNGTTGGLNLGTWSLFLTESPPSSEAEALIASAATAGGDASLMDVSGVSWILRAFSSVGPLAEAAVSRSFTSSVGLKLQCRVQYVGDSTGLVQIFALGSNGAQMRVQTDGGGNWMFENPNPTDTGIPSTSPIEILYTQIDSNTHDIRVTELVAPFTQFSLTGVSFFDSTGSAPLFSPPDFIAFASNTTDSFTFPSGESLIINSMIHNPTGTLPVELSAFELE
jgi:hypothetical protein